MPEPLTLMAFPGLGLGPEAWRPTLDHLGGSVRTLPGFGKPAPRTENLSPAAVATRVVAELEANDRKAVLLGHSASCQVAAWVAAAAPDRIAALVLVGPTTDPRAATWRRLVARWLATAVHETPRQVPLLVRQYSRTTLPVMVRAMESVRHDDISEPLARAAVPTLVVRGRHDAICPADWAERVAALGGAGSRAVTLPAGAHMVPLTHGRLVAAAVSDFLAG
ncbi:alpha/beta fold hydrolase [Knoellia sp. CPCC 206450]|uniref:alpha/beta fold hydrolase n=1 Tax=Knoellia tibetensis TaxID=3404798 RepID=UPI003B42D1FD